MQEAFASEYLLDLNATQAAIRAGYSLKTARAIGAENLTKPDINSAIQLAINERVRRTETKADKVITHLAEIAFADIFDFLVSDPKTGILRLKPIGEVSKGSIGGLRSLEIDGNKLKIQMHSKLKALELLGRHLGMFK